MIYVAASGDVETAPVCTSWPWRTDCHDSAATQSNCSPHGAETSALASCVCTTGESTLWLTLEERVRKLEAQLKRLVHAMRDFKELRRQK